MAHDNNDIVHFAVHADDCLRCKAFYEKVFGWAFEPWGPPEFWLIHTSPEAAVLGALQKRQQAVEGRGMIGYECTIGVSDVEATAQAIEANGGRVLLQPFVIESVGRMLQFEDPEGNLVNAMQYAEGVR